MRREGARDPPRVGTSTRLGVPTPTLQTLSKGPVPSLPPVSWCGLLGKAPDGQLFAEVCPVHEHVHLCLGQPKGQLRGKERNGPGVHLRAPVPNEGAASSSRLHLDLGCCRLRVPTRPPKPNLSPSCFQVQWLRVTQDGTPRLSVGQFPVLHGKHPRSRSFKPHLELLPGPTFRSGSFSVPESTHPPHPHQASPETSPGSNASGPDSVLSEPHLTGRRSAAQPRDLSRKRPSPKPFSSMDACPALLSRSRPDQVLLDTTRHDTTPLDSAL